MSCLLFTITLNYLLSYNQYSNSFSKFFSPSIKQIPNTSLRFWISVFKIFLSQICLILWYIVFFLLSPKVSHLLTLIFILFHYFSISYTWIMIKIWKYKIFITKIGNIIEFFCIILWNWGRSRTKIFWNPLNQRLQPPPPHLKKGEKINNLYLYSHIS